MLYWMYFLVLEGGYYYIGITSRTPSQRIAEHFAGRGAFWTMIHTPVGKTHVTCLGYVSEREAHEREAAATRAFMRIYGYNKVRGGQYVYSGNYVKYKDRYIPTNLAYDHWS